MKKAMRTGYPTADGGWGMRATCLAGALGSAMIVMAAAPVVADEVLTATAQISVGRTTSFDISYVSPSQGYYLLGDRSNKAVDVIDTRGLTFLGFVGQGLFTGATGNNNTSGPDGVVMVNGNQIWVGDGDSTLKIFSTNTGGMIANISTGGVNRVDEMCFDPVHQRVLAANNAESPFPFATLFNAQTHQILRKITFDGTNGTPMATNGVEQCQYDPRSGFFYIAIPEINGPGNNTAPGGVAVLDPVTGNMLTFAPIPITSCAGPQGMAIGPAPQILLGCNSPGPTGNAPTVIINESSLLPIFTVNNESGADMVDYNAATNHYTLARSAAVGANQLIGTIDAATGVPDPDFVTRPTGAPNAHSIASDSVMNRTFFPMPGGTGSTLCSSLGGVDANGCILVLQLTGTDTDNGDHPATSSSVASCTAQGAPVVRVVGGAPQLLTGSCK